MKLASGYTVIANGQLVDGNGGPPVKDAAVVVRDGKIAYAGPAVRVPEVPPDARRIDANGGTILPGLVEAHFHPTYFNVAELADLDIKYPVEYVTLLAAANARLALERMLRDLRWVKSSSDLTTLTPSQLSFVDTGGNTVTFTYDSVAKTLSRQQNGGNINILANNVSSFTLSYLATDGQSTATLASQVLYVTIQMTISTSGNQPYSAQYMGSVRLYNA